MEKKRESCGFGFRSCPVYGQSFSCVWGNSVWHEHRHQVSTQRLSILWGWSVKFRLPFKLNLQCPSVVPHTDVHTLPSGFVCIYFPLLNLLTLSPSDPVDMKTSASTEWSSLQTGTNARTHTGTQTHSLATCPFVFSALQRWLPVLVFMRVCVYAPSQQLVGRAGKERECFTNEAARNKPACICQEGSCRSEAREQ